MQNVKTTRSRFVVIAGAVGIAMVGAGAAHAAYSGLITRSVCMAGSMVPRNPDRNFWDNTTNTTCSAKVIDTGSATNFHWARVSIPVERQTSTVTISPTVLVDAGTSGDGQVCSQFWIESPSGNLTTGADDCSGPPFGFETLTPGSLTLPINGAVLVDIAAQNNGQAHIVGVTWTANGT